MDYICGLIGFIAVLAAIAVVGHLLWLMAAGILRWLGVPSSQSTTGELAGDTAHSMTAHGGEGQGGEGDTAQRVERDLRAAGRLVAYAHFRGWLSDSRAQTLQELLEDVQLRAGMPPEVAVPLSVEPVRDRPTPGPLYTTEPVRSDSTASLPPVEEPELVVASIEAPSTQPSLIAASATDASQPRSIGQEVGAHLLRSFMEQTNIRWIELISASLIVVCSVGLVISLWSTLSSTSRYFPSLVFLLATVAVHGAGQYTLRKWNLRNTSRGILHIGLMLIPLAVLVGILLSSRDNLPVQWDITTWITLATGAIVYGVAAITAGRALFGRRFWPVSLAVMVGSSTLIAIHVLASDQQLQRPLSAVCLLPLVAISLWNAWILSVPINPAIGIGGGRSRRRMAQVLQVIFAAGVPYYFWWLRSGQESFPGPEALSTLGLILAGWASWGWSESLPRLAKRWSAGAKPSAGSLYSWYIIAAWSLAGICSLALAAIIWHMSTDRGLFSLFLLAVAIWLWSHGLRSQQMVSLLVGSVSGILACALGSERWVGDVAAQLSPSQWISLPRIATLSIVSLLFGLIGIALKRWSSTEYKFRRAADRLSLSMILGMAVVLSGAAALTVVASLLPWSQPAFGGNWAPLLLLGYGSLMIVASLICAVIAPTDAAENVGQSSSSARQLRWAHLLVPVGQLMLILSAVRLCQNSSLMPEWIERLRPEHAWAVGTGLLAVLWSGLAAGLRGWKEPDGPSMPNASGGAESLNETAWRFWQHSSWLCIGAGLLSFASGAAYFTRDDHWSLASSLGWIVPASLLGSFVARRLAVWRELTVASLVCWAGLVVAKLMARQWLEPLGITAAMLLHVVAALVVLAAYELYLSAGDSSTDWRRRGPYWASSGWLHILWPISLLAIAVPLLIDFGRQWLSETYEPLQSFYVPQMTPLRLSVVATGWLLLGAVALWLRPIRNRSVRGWLSTWPIGAALIVGSLMPAPYGLVAALWLVAVWALVMEVLPLTKLPGAAALQQAAFSECLVKLTVPWPLLMQAVCLSSLVIGTVAVLAIHLLHGLPVSLGPSQDNFGTWSGWLANVGRLLIVLGPLVSLLAVGWLVAAWLVRSPNLIAGRGLATAGGIALICGLAGTDQPIAFELVAAQSFALALAILSWKTLSMTTLTNWIALRHLDKQSSPWQLLSKASRGARWRGSEQAAFRLTNVGMGIVAMLCAVAAGMVMYYPQRALPELDRMGGMPVAVTVLATLVMMWVLWPRRSASPAGLLAISLGLMAPVAAAGYASWLVKNPTGQFASADDFEPYRLLAVLWLAALVIGLLYRIRCAMTARPFTLSGEVAWIVLATIVGVMSLAALDADSIWASAQLAVLAAIITISSEASRQGWRGHLAMLIAIAAWVPWMSGGTSTTWIHYPWQVLWGATGVGLVAIGSRLGLKAIGLTQEASKQEKWPTVDHVACLGVSGLSIVLSGCWILSQAEVVANCTTATWVVFGLLIANFLLAVARLWDRGPSQRGMGVYLATIALVVVAVNTVAAHQQLLRLHSELAWLIGLLGALAALAVVLRELILQRAPLQQLLRLNELVEPDKLHRASGWMSNWHMLVAAVCLVPNAWLVLNMPDMVTRVMAMVVPMLGAAAVLPLAGQPDRSVHRYTVILISSVTLVLAWWSDLPPAWPTRQQPESWLYLQRAMLACVILGIAYPLLASRRAPSDLWSRPLLGTGWCSLGLATMLGCSMIVAADYWAEYTVQASVIGRSLVVVAWSAIFARLLQFAARPLQLESRASAPVRSAAVYAAELVLAAGCVAAHKLFPHLFSGVLASWWPIVIFAIAFASAALGHILRKIEQPILADPIHRSSLLLPLIPLAGVWWFRPQHAGWLWNDWGSYWLLLLTAASLYGLHGWLRNSLWWRATSVLLALASFWAYLHSQPELRFFQHPQFWLLPPTLATLIFVEWNRAKLQEAAVTGARYVCILIAYFSSTAEIFMRALAGNLWQPLWLLILALSGVAAGIVLRVRAFLFCGTLFVMVALVAMVWQAAQAVDQVWPWWVFGIATGIGLIVMLGYFEKNRPRVLKYLDELKRWQN
ncbi:MAG: hypothetical protein KF752_17275 [Pirellulaceae bacterium]|nr:hypothetical protein [Pirellulaceae bacterium]